MFTRIGKMKKLIFTKYTVCCEAFDGNHGLMMVPVVYTSDHEMAYRIATMLNQQLLEGVYDQLRVTEFFVEGEDIASNTEVDDEMLREFIAPEHKDESWVNDFMTAVYRLEEENES